MKRNLLILTLLSISLVSCIKFLSEDDTNTILNERRSFTATDLHKLNKISSPQLSSDANYLVFQISQWTPGDEAGVPGVKKTSIRYLDLKNKDKGDTIIAIEGNTPTLIGNKLFYLTKSFDEIRYISFPPQDPVNEKSLVKYKVPINDFKFSSSLKAFAFSAKIFYDLRDSKNLFDEVKKRLDETQNQTWQEYDQIMVNHWDVWNDGSINAVFYQAININGDSVSVDPDSYINLTKSLVEGNSPVPPFGGTDLYDISPDGTKVAFSFSPRLNEAVNTSWRTYLADCSNISAITVADISTDDKVPANNFVGRTQNPKFSDDSNILYFLAMPRAALESDYTFISSYNLTTKIVTKHTQIETKGSEWKYGISDFSVSYNHFIMVVDYDGVHELFTYPVDPTLAGQKQNVKQITKWENNTKSSKSIPFAIVENGDKYFDVYLTETSDMFPDRIAKYIFDDKQWETEPYAALVLHDPNPDFYNNFLSSEQIRIEFQGATPNLLTQGWIIKPVNYEEGKVYRTALIIHGGPEGSFGNTWSYRWNPLLWASKGFAVIMINPEGSTGKGQDFTDAVRGRWGAEPYQTIMLGLKYAQNNFRFISKDNVCAAGASYGGYMVNWIQGKESDNKTFKCLVTHDGVFSTLSMFYITDELWFPLAEYCKDPAKNDCYPWNNKENFTMYSPETLVEKWNTPHLIIHGSMDLRIPFSEGVSAFNALQMRSVPSKLLHFPLENHWVLQPQNSIGWYDQVLGWMESYTYDPVPVKTSKEEVE